MSGSGLGKFLDLQCLQTRSTWLSTSAVNMSRIAQQVYTKSLSTIKTSRVLNFVNSINSNHPDANVITALVLPRHGMGIIKYANQLTTRFFFFFPLFSPELGGELLISDAFPGVSIRTCGVLDRPRTPEGVFIPVPRVALEVAFTAAPAARSFSPTRDKMKEPGSPVSGCSSMNSSPY